jgi:hypothetical protein
MIIVSIHVQILQDLEIPNIHFCCVVPTGVVEEEVRELGRRRF